MAHGSVQQVYAVGLKPHATVSLLNRRGRTVAAQKADALGGIVFRNVAPGRGYRLRAGARRSAAVTVMPDRSAPPSTKVYGQKLPAGGYGYLRTRDGTSLAIDVRLPGPASAGPYPTLVEYAGYGYADPAGAESGISAVANLLGFAVVDVNMRGTGCSGGSFNYFEPLQGLDGYDVIETVARQPWVLGHRVGMLGISYGGISQLFVGATDPPHLAAITPLSVIDNTATTLYPGGMLNTGFALDWAKERVHDALPASADRAGSRGRSSASSRAIRPARPTRCCTARPPTRSRWSAPTTTSCPRWPTRWRRSRSSRRSTSRSTWPASSPTSRPAGTVPTWPSTSPAPRASGSRSPTASTSTRWTRRRSTAGTTSWSSTWPIAGPRSRDATKALAPTVFSTAMGIDNVTLPTDPIQSEPSYAAALAAFQALKPIRVLFDNGAGSSTPGAPYPGFEQSFSRFPIPGTRAQSWYLARQRGARRRQAGGGLQRPVHLAAQGAPGHQLQRRRRRRPWRAVERDARLPLAGQPRRDGRVLRERAAERQHRRHRGGAVQLWIKASAPSVDLQATVSEVRPDGKETFVQNGWLRASERKLDAAQSTLLAPVLSLRKADVAPLPAGRYTEVTVPLYYEGHAYRKGSRIRVTIAAPGGDQPVWAFSELNPHGTAKVFIAHSAEVPLTAGPAGGARGERADRPAAVPGPARRAVPHLRAVRQPRRRAVGGRVSRIPGRIRTVRST